MPDNRFFNQQSETPEAPGYGPVQYGFGQTQHPFYPTQAHTAPYPPPNANEMRLTAILERLQHKVNSIFAKQLLIEKMLNHMHGQEALSYRSITDDQETPLK